MQFNHGNCAVSICRSGEAMEKGLRECCRSIRIGKMLIESDPRTNEARVLYARLLPDMHRRRVLLLYPLLSMYHFEMIITSYRYRQYGRQGNIGAQREQC